MKFFRLPLIITVGLLPHWTDTRANEQKKNDGSWTVEFAVEKSELSATGRNPYFILESGYQLVFEGGRERLIISVGVGLVQDGALKLVRYGKI